MPLRDHFKPPYGTRRWSGFHALWPGMFVQALNKKLPQRFVASPSVNLGTSFEIDVAAFEEPHSSFGDPVLNGENGGVATAVWAPPHPTLEIATDLPAQDEYEVRIYDEEGYRLVAAVEIVSPANKDRPDNRHAFVTKCAALLQQHVCVAIIDVATPRQFNLYAELLAMTGQSDPGLPSPPPALYAVVCRCTPNGESWRFQAWTHTLELGQPLPTLPLWLTRDFAVPLELEATYEETCKALRIA